MSSWKGFKGSHRAASEGSDSPTVPDAFTAAMATVVRAPPKDFRVVRQEWAAIRIQTAFRGFLVSFSIPFSFHVLFLFCPLAKHNDDCTMLDVIFGLIGRSNYRLLKDKP